MNTPPVSSAPGATAGMLVGRPDLSDDAVLTALGELLAHAGRAPDGAAAVLEAARDGQDDARVLLRQLVLPAPEARLAMPIQPLRRERRHAPAWSFAGLSLKRR